MIPYLILDWYIFLTSFAFWSLPRLGLLLNTTYDIVTLLMFGWIIIPLMWACEDI